MHRFFQSGVDWLGLSLEDYGKERKIKQSEGYNTRIFPSIIASPMANIANMFARNNNNGGDNNAYN